MDLYVFLALAALVLLIAELVLPTGGFLAALGAAGLVASGIVALTAEDGTAADVAGAGLITLGVLSAISFYFIAGKVIAAHRNRAVMTGTEELVGATARARSSVGESGSVWVEGALWSARLADGAPPVRLGDRVRVEAVEGLTLVVRPEPAPAQPSPAERSNEGDS